MDHQVLAELVRLRSEGERAVLALVTEVSGSAPQVTGARLVLRQDGTLVGTVGGGRFELEVVRTARKMFQHGGSQVLEFDLGPDLGMQCGGAMKAYLEVIESRQRLVLFGAGHVGLEVATIAARLPFDVLVVDDRADFATAERFPGCALEVAPFPEAARTFRPQPRDYLLIVTHGHKHDRVLLESFVEGPQAYLGMIGSRTKVAGILRELGEAGVPLAALEAVHTPVGLGIGAVTPGEIAISILAEMICHRRRGASTTRRSVEPAE